MRKNPVSRPIFQRIASTATAIFLVAAFLSTATADEPQNPNPISPAAEQISDADPDAPAPDAETSDALPGIVAEASPEVAAGIDAYLEGDIERAYRLFKIVYDADQDSDPPGVFLALMHSNYRRLLEMRRSLEQTAEDYPTDPEAFLQLAGIDVQEGRYLEAALLLERAERLIGEYAKRFPNSKARLPYLREEALTVRANLAERRGRFDAAAAFVQKIVDANPENAQARWNLGYLNVKLDNLDAAEKAFDAAADLDPQNWRGWIQVATALDREERIADARARLETQAETIAAAPKRERAQLARLYMRWNLLPEATKIVDEFEKDGDPNNFDRWILLGWLALYANRYAVAEENFRNALFLDQTSFEASNGLALALLDQNDKEKLAQALNIATENYRRSPDSIEAAATYGWTLFLSKKTKEADEIFGPILNSGAATATVAYYLAEIANLRGDPGLALNLLDLALDQEFNFPKRAAAVELRALIAPPENEAADAENADSAEKSPTVPTAAQE